MHIHMEVPKERNNHSVMSIECVLLRFPLSPLGNIFFFVDTFHDQDSVAANGYSCKVYLTTMETLEARLSESSPLTLSAETPSDVLRSVKQTRITACRKKRLKGTEGGRGRGHCRVLWFPAFQSDRS